MATAECHSGGGLNSSSGGELKLYLGCIGSNELVQSRFNSLLEICLMHINYIFTIVTIVYLF